MEIRNVVNDVKNEYPKIEQIKQKHLKDNIPNKWKKIGISSLVIAMMTKNNVFALSPHDIKYTNMDLAGGVATPVATPIDIIISILGPLSFIAFILSGFGLLIAKIKSRKQGETSKAKKWLTVVFLMSIILYIINIIVRYAVSYTGY